MKTTLVVVLALAALTFAGCAEAPEEPTLPSTPHAGPGSTTAQGLTADSVVDAPDWAVGDYFGHHIFFGSEDAKGTHIDAVVVDDSGGSYALVSNQEEAAKWEAAWDFPMLGSIGKQNLETTAFTADWNLYNFPLSDGKTWTATFNPLFSGARDLTMTATFNDAIPTIGQGKKAGFVIEGVNADGEVELRTDYIPHIGWYSELTYFDPLTADPDDFILRVWGMGQGNGWNGTTVTAEATSLVNGNSPCFAPLNQDGSVNQACTTPADETQFTVSEGSDQLYGIMLAGALAGRSQMEIFNLEGSGRGHATIAHSQSMEDFQFVFDFVEIDDPGSGDWIYYWYGAGFVTFGYAQLWEIQFTETPFP